MKAVHVGVLVAVLAVGAAIYFLLDTSGGHAGTRGRPDLGGGDQTTTRPTKSDGDDDGETAGLVVTLRILEPGGRPAADCRLDFSGNKVASGITGRDGSARVPGLAPGAYSLLARAGRAALALQFDLREDRDLGTLTLQQALRIGGHVYDASGKPIGGADVDAVRGSATASNPFAGLTQHLTGPDAVAASARSAADGSYELFVPGGGLYGVRAAAAGFAFGTESTREVADDIDGIDFYLVSGVPVSGRVVSTEGGPVAGALVMVRRAPSFGQPGYPKSETRTAADGTFSLPAPPVTFVPLSVLADGFALYSDSRVRMPATSLRITLEPGVSLRLRTVMEDTGEPVAGIEVRLQYYGVYESGTTDESGEFLAQRIPTRGKAGFGAQRQLTLTSGGVVPQFVRLDSYEVRDGVIDVGDITVARGGIVRGRVIEKGTGRAVPDAKVHPFGGVPLQLSLMGGNEAVSRADGSYELTGVPLNAQLILATHEHYVSEIEANDLFKSMRSKKSGIFGLIEEGRAEAQHDIELLAAQTIIGVVLTADGQPLAGARIAPSSRRGGWTSMLFGGLREAHSDAKGEFEIPGMRPGEKTRILATHRAYTSSDLVDAVAGSGQAVTLRMAAPARLVGRVVDKQDQPVSGVRVAVSRKKGKLPITPGMTDELGRFVVRNLPAGELRVHYDHVGFSMKKTLVTVEPGTTEHDVGAVVLHRGHSIRGRVVDSHGDPMADISVNVNFKRTGPAMPRAPALGDQGRWWVETRTDEDGSFVVFGLIEGKYDVSPRAQGLFGERGVAETGGKAIELKMLEAAELTGVVTANGQPVNGAQVRAQKQDDGGGGIHYLASARTADDGSFTLKGLPPSETFEVRISHNHYEIRTLEGVRATSARQEFTLSSGHAVAGIVTDPDGEPIAGVSMRVMVEGKQRKWTASDEHGRFEVSGLPSGVIEIQITGTQTGHIRGPHIAVDAGDMDLRIVLQPGHTIKGTVAGPDGKPRQRVMIEVLDKAGKTIGSVWVSGKEGSFEINGLEQGTYALRVRWWMEDGQNGSLETEVKAPSEDVAITVDH